LDEINKKCIQNFDVKTRKVITWNNENGMVNIRKHLS
jgi:hypothetical protein